MKKLLLILSTLLLAGASNANAAVFQLNAVDSNVCDAAANEVNLLNGPDHPFIQIYAYCEAGRFVGTNDGLIYNYQMHTTVSLPYNFPVGQAVTLNLIDTNQCDWASHEIILLNTPQVGITTQCVPGIFHPTNGGTYNFQLVTTLMLNY